MITPNQPQWLSQSQTSSLIAQIQPTGDLSHSQKQAWQERFISRLGDLTPSLEQIAQERATILLESHRRLRKLTQSSNLLQVTPQLPLDILGIYILLPS